MNAFPIQDSACRKCGEALAPNAGYCPHCGAPVRELPPLETVHGPAVRSGTERRRARLPARFVLLCLGFAALGAAVGFLATGSWVLGLVLLLVAGILLAALAEATRPTRAVWLRRSSRLAADGRAQAATAAEVWRARLDASFTRWRTQSRLDSIAVDRGPAFRALGEAAWRGDASAERGARERLVELELEAQRIEDELAERLADAGERIRRARLPVQDTVLASPSEPYVPYPPPDEGNPPQPAEVPEPFPPPDEGTPPVPAPDPGQPERE